MHVRNLINTSLEGVMKLCSQTTSHWKLYSRSPSTLSQMPPTHASLHAELDIQVEYKKRETTFLSRAYLENELVSQKPLITHITLSCFLIFATTLCTNKTGIFHWSRILLIYISCQENHISSANSNICQLKTNTTF